LIEMLLVVVIVTTLVAMIVPRFAGRSEEAKTAAATADIQANISSALDLYELDNGFYPSSEQGLDALRTSPTSAPVPKKWKGPYIKRKAVKDPWGNPYVYRSPGIHNTQDYDLYSYGPDGMDGGEDDVTNWDSEE